MNPSEPVTTPYRTLIVEDQGMVRSFLERWLGTLPGFELVASARSGEEALELVESTRPDLALVDYQLPGIDGLEFVHTARQVRPQLRALVLSTLSDPLTLIRIRESNVEGYIEKDATPELLAEALQAIAAGRRHYSAKFHQTMAREGANALSVGKILSRREQQVLTLVLARKTTREIAEHMGLSPRTVEFHRANLMSKLDAKSLADLEITARLRSWTPL